MSARIVVTGGSGFLGSLLARRLLGGPVALGGAAPADVAELTLVVGGAGFVGSNLVRALLGDEVREVLVVDNLLSSERENLPDDARVRFVHGPLDAVRPGEADAVFHLAGVVSGAAEADFDLGMRTNIDGTRAVLEYGRRHAVPPLVVFTSQPDSTE